MEYLVNSKKALKHQFQPHHDQPGLVSISQVQQMMKCPKSWAFNYLEKITPRVERPYLTVGKLCHAGMAAAWNERFRQQTVGADDIPGIYKAGAEAILADFRAYMEANDFLPEEIPEQEANKSSALHIFYNALQRVDPSRFYVVGLDLLTPMVEYHFIVPCPGSKGMHGYIDAVLQEVDTGHIWAVDWKFRSQMSSDAEEPFNLQNAVYNYALHKMGVRVTGSLTWQHLNQPPAIPSMNKNGTMSRAKIRTTWEDYKSHLEAARLDPEEYREEMQDKLADIVWDRQTKEYRNDLTLQQTWQQIIVPVVRQIASKRKKITYAMFPWNCKICHYNPICLAEMRGYDVDFIKEAAYMPKPEYRQDVKNLIDTNEDGDV